MKKKTAIFTIILFLLGAGVYSLAMFMLSGERETAFWAVYGFTVAAFVFPLCVQLYLSGDRYASSSGAWTFPPVICGTIYLLVQVILGVVLLLSHAPVKLSVVLQAIVLAAYWTVTAMMMSGMKYTEDLDQKQARETVRIQELILEAERMYQTESDPKRKQTFKKVYEAIRYSDPVSKNAELQMMDEQIAQSLSYLRVSESLDSDADALLRLIAERGVVCRNTK